MLNTLSDFIATLKLCRNCGKNCKLNVSARGESYGWSTHYYVENNSFHVMQRDFAGYTMFEAIFNKNGDESLTIVKLNHLPDPKWTILISGHCKECNSSNFIKRFNIDQQQKTFDFHIAKETFQNDDFIISHDYNEKTSIIIKKEKKIELELASKVILTNLDFERLYKTSLLLK